LAIKSKKSRWVKCMGGARILSGAYAEGLTVELFHKEEEQNCNRCYPGVCQKVKRTKGDYLKIAAVQDRAL
jgi:hypothetical protein